MRARRGAGVVLAVVLCAATTVGWFQTTVSAQRAAATAVTDIPRLPFEKFTLPNGLEVILSVDRRLPLVAVNVWYHVGPANEEPGRTGFAHLFEHLMFQGSKHVPSDSHFRILEAAGGTGINGTTDFDRTNYFETVPSNQLELALWIESDRMGYLLDTVDEKAFANQQDVVRNERRQTTENRPYGLAEEAVVQLLYPKGHPYYGSVIGSHEDIQAARLDDAKQFFKRYYAPNNASLAIVGDIDPAQVKALVQKYFGTLRRGPAVPPIAVTTPPITSERRKMVTDRVELPRVYMAWLTPSIFKPGDAEATLAAAILGGGRSSRLYQSLVYEKQIAQDVSSSQQSLLLGSQFDITATARPGHTAEELEKAIDEELERLRQKDPDAAEIDRARNTIETRVVTRLETLGGFGGVADRLNLYNHYLKNPDFLRQDMARYRAVTPAAVTAFVRTHLQPSARVVVHVAKGTPDVGPAVPTPPAPTVSGTGAESVNADEPWRREQPKPASARALTVPAPESAELPNGLRVILNARKGLPVVAANLVVRTGSDANPPNLPGVASFTVAMLDQGTATRSATQIAIDAAQLGATVAATSSMDASIVTARSLKKTFPQALALAGDLVLHPSFPAQEIERQRGARLGQLAQQRENTNALAGRVMAAALYGDRHPYGFTELGTEASVRAVSRDAMVEFWKTHFVPNNAALVVAGDITMSELRPLAERVFGSWARGEVRSVTPTAPMDPTPHIVIVDRPGATQTQLRVATVGAPRQSPDYYALEVMNAVLGGTFASRINMNLREEHGYTYGAGSGFAFRRGAGPFQIATGVRTDVTAPAVSEILKEVRRMNDAPASAEELALAKDGMTRSLASDFQTSANSVGVFGNLYIYDLGLDYFRGYAAGVNAVTAEQALAAARKYVAPGRLVVIAIGDRTRIEPGLKELGVGPVEVFTP